MRPRPQQYHVVLIPVEQGWVAYQILRWADGALVAGGECPTRRAAVAMAKCHAAQLLNERVAA